jgi:hypothetical protein
MLLGYLFSSVFHECLKRYSKCKSKKSLFCTENIVVLVLCGGRASVYVVVLRDCIDASYQVSVHLAKGFQRRRLKCEKFTEG